MHTSTIASMPWVQDTHTQRSSFASRVSGFFGRRNENNTSYQSPRATTTFEVPLFLSPTRYDPRHDHEDFVLDSDTTQHHLPQAESTFGVGHSPNIRESSVYSTSGLGPFSSEANTSVTQNATEVTSSSQTHNVRKPRKHKKRKVQHQRKRKTSLKRQLQTAKQLSLAFGITFLLAAVTYLVLAATGVASGTIFHIIFVLLLLILFGVFLHSSCRWIIFWRRRRERRRHKTARGQWCGQDIERADHGQMSNDGDEMPAQPIRIIMKEDDTTDGVLYGSATKLQHPPPTYGNLRESKRIDPNLVHWQKVPPSPLTPTYAEAMVDVQRVVGYRPPSYIESDCGATQIIETQRIDVDGSLQHIHPLCRNGAGH